MLLADAAWTGLFVRGCGRDGFSRAVAAGTGLFTHDCGRDGPRYLVIPLKSSYSLGTL